MIDHVRARKSGLGRVWRASAGSAAAVVLASGCSTKPTVIAEPPARAYQAPPPFDPSGRLVSEGIPSVERDAATGPTLIGQQRLTARVEAGEGVEATALERDPGELIEVRASLKSADFSDVLRVLLGDHLQRDYVIDPKVTGPVTLEIDGEYTKTEVMDLVGHLGSIYGWFVEEREGVLFVRATEKLAKAADAPVLNSMPVLTGDQPAVRVRRLKHVGADQVSNVLKELISDQAKALVAGRTIIIADTTRQIARLSKLISALDTPSFDGVEVWTYRLGNRKPEDAQKILEQLATGTGLGSGADGAVAFLAVPGTQRLMVVAKDGSMQPMLRDLLQQVDQPTDGERRQRYIYRVQHYPQAALVKLMTDFFGEKMEAAPGGPASTSTEPGSRIRMVADTQSDLLLIHATPTDYADMLATLRAVDRAPQQVVVQSIIAEVRLTKNLEFGVEYFLSGRSTLGEFELTGTAPLLNPALATGGAFFIGGDGFAVINALDRESEARVLSQPKIVMSDRSKGSIQVGGEVPTIRATQGAATQQVGSSDIRTEIEYRDTGVILDIEPQINESGLVTLKITQDVRDALPSDVANTPEFTTRKIETTVVVPSGHTVLLGGIIIRDDRRDADRIPLAGRVPVLGELFSNKANTNERTELLLTITPTIVNEPAGLAGATGEFILSIEAVRSALLESAEDLPTGALEGLSAPPPLNAPADRPERAEDMPKS